MALTIYKDWRDFPMDQWRWQSFKPWEVACKDGGNGRQGIPKTLAIDESAMDCLQRLLVLVAFHIGNVLQMVHLELGNLFFYKLN